MQRVYNFAAGPAVMPAEALTTAANEMLCYGDTGMSVMEMSHRSKMYQEIFNETEALVRELMHVPDDYAVLFIQGGATGQFAGVAMNLLTGSGKADYVDSGNFAHGAFVEAQKYGSPRCVASSREEGYVRIPDLDEKTFDPEADYFYITTNNTIYGTRFASIPETGKVPLVADMSSNILSEPYDVSKFGVIFAGAQKNIGPAGFALTIVRRDLIGRAMPITPKVLDYKKLDDAGSMLNTPPTYAIYMAGLCLKWLKKQGGVEGIAAVNREKASWLYDFHRRKPPVQGRGREGQPLADERHLPHRRRGSGRRVRQGRDQSRPCQHQGPPLRGRHARQHLQRHAPGGRQGAGGVHEEI